VAGGQAGLTLELNDYRFHVIDSGTGPGVLLLHGVGTTSEVWREQVPVLVAAGFRVVAPDLRGLGGAGEERNLGETIDDIRGILRTLGVPRVHVVGQDRGAELAWMFANTQAQKVDRLVVIGSGYPNAERFAPVEKPVMAIWGARDAGVGEATVLAAREHVSGPWRYERLEDTGREIPTEQPARLNELLLDFLAPGARPPRAPTDVRAMVGKPLSGALTERLRPSDTTADSRP